MHHARTHLELHVEREADAARHGRVAARPLAALLVHRLLRVTVHQVLEVQLLVLVHLAQRRQLGERQPRVEHGRTPPRDEEQNANRDDVLSINVNNQPPSPPPHQIRQLAEPVPRQSFSDSLVNRLGAKKLRWGTKLCLYPGSTFHSTTKTVRVGETVSRGSDVR